MVPYGMYEAERQLEMIFESWITGEAGLRRVAVICHLFFLRDYSGNIITMIAEIADDLQMAGTIR